MSILFIITPDIFSITMHQEFGLLTSFADWALFIFLSTLFCVGNGFMFGWAISLFTTCGVFDRDAFVSKYLVSHGCQPHTPCSDQIVREAGAKANDVALRTCFHYCPTGIVIGFIALLGWILFVCLARHRYSLQRFLKWSRIYGWDTDIEMQTLPRLPPYSERLLARNRVSNE